MLIDVFNAVALPTFPVAMPHPFVVKFDVDQLIAYRSTAVFACVGIGAVQESVTPLFS